MMGYEYYLKKSIRSDREIRKLQDRIEELEEENRSLREK